MKYSMTMEFIVTAIAVFAVTVVAERILIPILRSHKAGQRILDIGPRWHKAKEGTPIMGGIGFILAMLLAATAFFVVRAVRGTSAQYIPLALTLAFAVCNGAIGFVDDYCKLIKKQNEGLKWYQKLILQFAIAIAFVCVMSYTGYMDTDVAIPFTNRVWHLGWGFYPMAVISLVGIVNGGNITDGIDGLASSVSWVIGGLFAVWAFAEGNESLGLVGAILLGSMLGFLIYNFHPARIFMGDTGSLFLGALVIGSCFMAGRELVGFIVCAVFIFEMFTSFLQVAWFRISHGKRLFKMAPFHHHLEKSNWNEYQIVGLFFVVEIAVCVVAWFAK